MVTCHISSNKIHSNSMDLQVLVVIQTVTINSNKINKTSRMTNQIYRVDNTCRTIKLLLHLELLAQECRVQIRGEIGEEIDSKTSNQVVEQTARKMWQ